MASGSEIGQLANQGLLRRTSGHVRSAEPAHVRTLPVIDNSLPYVSNVRTSVDCYVSGQYVQRNGQVIEVTQRYSIFISYNKTTHYQTMQHLQERIASDFQARYGAAFNITTVYVPDLPAPINDNVPGVQPGQEMPIEFYTGSRLFKDQHEYQKLRLDIGKEHIKEKTNIQNLRKRYGFGKR